MVVEKKGKICLSVCQLLCPIPGSGSPNAVHLGLARLGLDLAVGFHVEVFVGFQGVDCIGGKVDTGGKGVCVLA